MFCGGIKPFGFVPDLDGDGDHDIVDRMILDDLENSENDAYYHDINDDWRLLCEDGSDYDIDHDDYDSQEEHEMALENARETDVNESITLSISFSAAERRASTEKEGIDKCEIQSEPSGTCNRRLIEYRFNEAKKHCRMGVSIETRKNDTDLFSANKRLHRPT